MTENWKPVAEYTVNKESPYYRELLPREVFDAIYNKLKQAAIGFLCSMDPSHAEIYKSLLPEYDHYLEDPLFKDNFYEFFAGCQDTKSELFMSVFKNSAFKLGCYLHFLKERDLSAKEIEKVPIKNPLYIIAVPRSGTSFTHSLFSADPKAQTVAMYEHFNPGNKIMTNEARIKIAEATCDSITEDKTKNFNSIHALMVTKPEEEMFFFEILGMTLVFGCALPRLEQYRASLITRDYDWVYKATIDEMKIHTLEFPFKDEKDFFCMKCATHFATPMPFFKIMCKDEYNPRIIWIHREPVGNLKSAILLYYNVSTRYPHDIGLDDVKMLNERVIKYTEIILKNAYAARDAWIAENPERAKHIYDVSFAEIIAHPKDVVKKIYDYFNIEYSEEYDHILDDVIQNGHPQKQYGRRAHEEDMYCFTPEEIRERFRFQYEKFGKYIPDFWGKQTK